MAENTAEAKALKKKKGKGKLAAFIIGFIAVAAIAVALYLHFDSIVVAASVGAALLVVLILAIIFRVCSAVNIAFGLFAFGYEAYKLYDWFANGGAFLDIINDETGYESILGIVGGILLIVSGIVALVAITKAKKAKTAPQQPVDLHPVPVNTPMAPVPVNPVPPVVKLDGKSYRLVGNELVPIEEQPQTETKQQPVDVAKGKEIQLKIGDGSDGSPVFITIKRD